MARMSADTEIGSIELHEQKRALVEKMFVHYDAMNTAAKLIQRRWRKNVAVAANNKLMSMSDREMLRSVLEMTKEISRSKVSIENRLHVLEQGLKPDLG